MYFTNYNTYNNNIKWKPDAKSVEGPPVTKKYIMLVTKQ